MMVKTALRFLAACFALVSVDAMACIINNSLLKSVRATAPQAENLRAAGTKAFSDWKETMEFFVTFEAITETGKRKYYAGYAQFGQRDCKLLKADYQEVLPVESIGQHP